MSKSDSTAVDVDTWFAGALELYRQGDFIEAELALNYLLERTPSHFDAWHLRGVLASRQGRPDRALEWFHRALRLNPRVAAAHRHLGNALRELGRFEEALSSYDTAIECRADFREAFVNRAMTHLMLHRPVPALDDLDRAIQLGADDSLVHLQRGTALYLLARCPEALTCCQKAIAAAPQNAAAHALQALCLLDLQQPHAALRSCDQALALSPDLADAWNTRGLALGAIQRIDDGLASFDQAISLKPEVDQPYINKGILYLLRGDFERGWTHYSRRRFCEKYAAATQRLPVFDGSQDIAGRTLLVLAEQGLGDTVQFCRYAKLLLGREVEIILVVQDTLCKLLRTLDPGVFIVGMSDVVPRADYQCALLNLPYVLNTRLQTIPSEVPYLRPDPDRVAFWRRRLGSDGRLIGIRWQGSTGRADIGRSFPVRHFEHIAAIPDVRLVSLQKHEGAEQLSGLPQSWQVEELGPDFESSNTDAFIDVAAVMECLDLVITSDTSIAHVAGALARPTWVALKHTPDWRWMLDREDSPWYPTMRLYRQTEAGSWESVFERMGADLREKR